MVTKKDLVIAVLATFCLTATLFMIIPTRSSLTTSQLGGYDPWRDLNDDGIIDIYDVVLVTSIYNSTGTPLNKTALLLELQSRVDSLNASILDLEAYLKTWITDLETSLVELQSKVEALETRIPKKGYIFISPVAFNSVFDEMSGGVDEYDFIRSSVLVVFESSIAWVDFSASVQLPHQSIITNMSVWIYDNSDYQINVWLSRYDSQTESADTMASVSTYPPTAKPSKVTLYDDTIIYPIIDNSRFMYSIGVRFQGDTSFPGDMALRLYGVLIEYEYSQ